MQMHFDNNGKTKTALMKGWIDWFKVSNRYKHFFVGFALGFLSFVLAVIGAFYKEIKDARSGGIFDKNDLFATLIGGAFGQCFSFVLWIILKTKLA